MRLRRQIARNVRSAIGQRIRAVLRQPQFVRPVAGYGVIQRRSVRRGHGKRALSPRIEHIRHNRSRNRHRGTEPPIHPPLFFQRDERRDVIARSLIKARLVDEVPYTQTARTVRPDFGKFQRHIHFAAPESGKRVAVDRAGERGDGYTVAVVYAAVADVQPETAAGRKAAGHLGRLAVLLQYRLRPGCGQRQFYPHLGIGGID